MDISQSLNVLVHLPNWFNLQVGKTHQTHLRQLVIASVQSFKMGKYVMCITIPYYEFNRFSIVFPNLMMSMCMLILKGTRVWIESQFYGVKELLSL